MNMIEEKLNESENDHLSDNVWDYEHLEHLIKETTALLLQSLELLGDVDLGKAITEKRDQLKEKIDVILGNCVPTSLHGKMLKSMMYLHNAEFPVTATRLGEQLNESIRLGEMAEVEQRRISERNFVFVLCVQYMLQQCFDLIVLLNIANANLKEDVSPLGGFYIPKINTDQILQDIKYLFKVITDCEKMAANNEDESGKYGNVCVANIVSLCKTFTLFIHILNSIGYEIPPAQI